MVCYDEGGEETSLDTFVSSDKEEGRKNKGGGFDDPSSRTLSLLSYS